MASRQAGDSNPRVFILLRHSEKEAGAPDPALSLGGIARTAFFARWLEQMIPPSQAIWSSDYRRTRDTAVPIAERLGLDIQIYNPRELPSVAATLMDANVNAVVIGHSNTTPELAALLCRCNVAPMNESDYETGYLVKILDDQRTISRINLQELWPERPVFSD